MYDDFEEFVGADMLIVDFWRWAYSDVLSNRNRGILAEYIVAHALGADKRPRVEWDAHDCEYFGFGIEVKCSAYIQNWKQDRLSDIIYDIAPKRAWHAETNLYSDEIKRNPDCYVFCLFNELNREKANPLNMNQWEFYIVATSELNERFGQRKTLGLATLQKFAQRVNYRELRDAVEQCLTVKI